ncbi:MAG: glycosyltransferase family protein [Balneolaceae bacterium]
MNILYGIQGTGHGHISRAREILPLLAEQANVEVLISGYNCHMSIDDIEIKRKRGISLAYDSNGGVSYLQTALQINPITFLKDVHQLDVSRYDLIISDYEPITAWAASAAGKPSVGLSHQSAFISDRSPRPEKISILAEQVMKRFAPCNTSIGFHFLRYDRFIEPPIIRQDVRNLSPQTGSHISVYLPAFDHQTLTNIFQRHKEVEWHIFSPLCKQEYIKQNVIVKPVGNLPFLESVENSLGVMTSAGFETCAEAMYLKKKLMVLPIKNQYEQLCNATALEKMGIQVAYNLGKEFDEAIKNWLQDTTIVNLPEIADTKRLTQKLIKYATGKTVPA